MPEPEVERGARLWAGRTPEHWVLGCASLAALAGLLLLGALTPDPDGHGTHEQLGLPACGWMAQYGIPCPGCGVTTALVLFARGRPLAALLEQPFGFALALGALAAAALAVLWQCTGRDLGRTFRRARKAPWILGGAFLMGLAWLFELAVLGLARA